jgi:hypothetical protein
MEAIKSGADLEVLSLLMRFGANMNLTDLQGKNALFYARDEANVEALRYLEKIRVMVIIIAAKTREKSRNSLRIVPKELLRKLSDFL